MTWSTPNPYVIDTRNVHSALPRAIEVLLSEGHIQSSRNGDVLLVNHPVITVYRRPWERVLFWHERDANPFFHFMEGLAFLGGRYDVDFFTPYAKQLAAYSDDGKTLPASYGHRWRTYFDRDQLGWAIERLRSNPSDRRTVISMWDPADDPVQADSGSKDVPCNTSIFLNVIGGRLDMMVNCRSNDIFWGCYGANAVHMSVLLEYLALSIGVVPGRYYQNSFNWHAYREFWNTVMNEREARSPETSLRLAAAGREGEIWDPYANGTFTNDGCEITARKNWHGPGLVALMDSNTHDRRADYQDWDRQLGIFLAGGSGEADGLTDLFLTTVAVPIREAHAAYRKKDYDTSRLFLEHCSAADWRKGCQDWLARRAQQRGASAAA